MKQPHTNSVIWLAVAALGFIVAIAAKLDAANSYAVVDGALFIGTACFVLALIAFWRGRLDNIRSD